MKRRAVLVLLALSPLAARAQAKLPRVGVLIGRDPGLYLEPLIAALKELGHVDGATIRLETRVAGGGAEQLAAHAEELVRLGVDVIAAFQTPAAKAAQRATRDIPVVFTAGDPVGTGLVASLARPGGNLTGWTGTTAELGGKRLEQLRELLPALRRVAVLINAQDPFAKPFREQIDEGAAALGVTIQPVLLRQGGELEAAFAALDADRPDAVIVQPSLPIRRAAELALRHRLPAAARAAVQMAVEGRALRTLQVVQGVLQQKPAGVAAAHAPSSDRITSCTGDRPVVARSPQPAASTARTATEDATAVCRIHFVATAFSYSL